MGYLSKLSLKLFSIITIFCQVSIICPKESAAQQVPTYCPGSYSSANFERIGEVKIANRGNPSTVTTGYENFISVNFVIANGAMVVLTPQFSGTVYPEFWAVYIDWNKDGVFAADERVFISNSASSSPQSFSLIVPTTFTGNTRMRVRMGYGSVSSVAACGTFSYGQVEDYTVSTQSVATPLPSPAPTPVPTAQATTTPTVALTATATPSPTPSNSGGQPDNSFGIGGKITISTPLTYSVTSLLSLTNGNTLIGGLGSTSAGQCGRVTRLLSSGALDTTFNGSGSITCGGPLSSSVSKINLCPDGKLQVWGGGLARYSDTGALDTSFTSTGWQQSALGGKSQPLVQPDGLTLFTGFTWRSISIGSAYYPALSRLTLSGSIDGTFASSGVATTTATYPPHPGIQIVKSLLKVSVNSSTRYLAVGSKEGSVPQAHRAIVMARFTDAGTTDFAFGQSGAVTYNIISSAPLNTSFGVNGASSQSSGKTVVASTVGSDLYLHRFHLNGSLDTTFGVSGWVTYPLVGLEVQGLSIGSQTDKIIVSLAHKSFPNSAGSALVKFTKDGILDTSFAGGFILIPDLLTSSAAAISPSETAVTVAGIDPVAQVSGKMVVRRYTM